MHTLDTILRLKLVKIVFYLTSDPMVRINWITLTAKYPGRCLIDGGPIRVGEKVEWCKGIGVRHISCGKKADQVEELKEKSFEAILHGNVDASRGFAQMAVQEPTTRLGMLGTGVTGLMGGTQGLGTTIGQAPPTTSPLGTALGIGSTLAGIYGYMNK